MNEVKIPYGLKNGKLLHISEVEEHGISCNCVCPICNTNLEARKGTKIQHYFAHSNKSNCIGAVETALHLKSKEIIDLKKIIKLPPVTISLGFDNWDPVFTEGKFTKPIVLFQQEQYKIDKVIIERKIDNIIPDLLVYIKGRPLIIEIYVNHKTGEEKIKKINQLGYAAIEIDLSKYSQALTPDNLTEILINSIKNKYWIVNKKQQFAQKKLSQFIDIKERIYRGQAKHVDNCPIKARVFRGKSYANIFDDCAGCEYCLDILDNFNEEKMFVICGGKSSIKNENELIEKLLGIQ